MKIQIDIITGFLGSGKTIFINNMLENTPIKNRVVVIQQESGETEIDNRFLEGRNTYVKTVDKEKGLTVDYLQGLIKKYLPHKIIIEHNGMENLENLLIVLETAAIRKSCILNKVVHTVDASTFEIFMNNMGSILIEQISNSDLILINNFENVATDTLNRMEKTLRVLNKSAEIVRSVFSDNSESIAADTGNIYEWERPSKTKTASDKLFMTFIGLVVLYLLFMLYRSADIWIPDLSGLQMFNTVFLSILIQAFPFILIGVFVSSILQVFISEEAIVQIFPKNKVLAYIVSILSGVFFPVCDCAIVPVAARLVKKGIPLSAAVTFMMSAPLVNPIVIASTFYAFPGTPSIAFYRVYLGITIALAVGVFIQFFPEEKPVLLNGIQQFVCKCGYCNTINNRDRGVIARGNAILKHAETEFFEVGRFLVIGAFLSSAMQTLIPRELLGEFGTGNVVPLLVMMASAFVLSVCSTSDAFIAKSFVNQFPMGSVMGFMVLGPMIDVKNTFMLLGSFTKRFVIKLLLIIFVLSFALLYFFSAILF